MKIKTNKQSRFNQTIFNAKVNVKMNFNAEGVAKVDIDEAELKLLLEVDPTLSVVGEKKEEEDSTYVRKVVVSFTKEEISSIKEKGKDEFDRLVAEKEVKWVDDKQEQICFDTIMNSEPVNDEEIKAALTKMTVKDLKEILVEAQVPTSEYNGLTKTALVDLIVEKKLGQ